MTSCISWSPVWRQSKLTLNSENNKWQLKSNFESCLYKQGSGPFQHKAGLIINSTHRTLKQTWSVHLRRLEFILLKQPSKEWSSSEFWKALYKGSFISLAILPFVVYLIQIIFIRDCKKKSAMKTWWKPAHWVYVSVVKIVSGLVLPNTSYSTAQPFWKLQFRFKPPSNILTSKG